MTTNQTQIRYITCGRCQGSRTVLRYTPHIKEPDSSPCPECISAGPNVGKIAVIVPIEALSKQVTVCILCHCEYSQGGCCKD